VQTAEPLARLQDAEVCTVDDVAEWDRHSNEYVPVEELKAADDPRWQAMLRGEWMVHEESPELFRQRVVDAIEGLVDAHSGDRIAVVCHGGVINGYLAHVLGLGVGQSFFYPNYTSIHRVAAARSGERSIVTINETSHLRLTGLPMGLFQGRTPPR
jgi:probable phosphoglycerate mutase